MSVPGVGWYLRSHVGGGWGGRGLYIPSGILVPSGTIAHWYTPTIWNTHPMLWYTHPLDRRDLGQGIPTRSDCGQAHLPAPPVDRHTYPLPLWTGTPTRSPCGQAHACENISCPVVGCTIHTHGNRTWQQRILFGASWSFEEKTLVKQSMISEWENVLKKSTLCSHYAMLWGGRGKGGWVKRSVLNMF